MLTALGKALRHLRIERGMLLKDMAEGMGVTPAFLSAVETGKKTAPGYFIGRLKEKFDLNDEEIRALRRAAEQSVEEVKISLPRDASDADREAMSVLARTFGEMSDSDRDELRNLLLRRRA